MVWRGGWSIVINGLYVRAEPFEAFKAGFSRIPIVAAFKKS